MATPLVGASLVPGPPAVPSNDGLRAARGAGGGVFENLPLTDDEVSPDDYPDGHWVAGYAMRRQPCKCGSATAPCHPSTITPVRPPSDRTGRPFAVHCEFTCSTLGMGSTDLAAMAQQSLNRTKYRQIATELWRGDVAQAQGWPNAFLADDSDPEWHDLVLAAGGVPGTHAFTYMNGLAEMEAALGQCTDGLRVIHANPSVVIQWDEGGGLRWEGGRIFTIRGTLVIADDGYDGSGPVGLGQPAASAAGSWIYGTGPIVIRTESRVNVTPPASDPGRYRLRTNDEAFMADQLAMVTWECCHLAAKVAANPPTFP